VEQQSGACAPLGLCPLLAVTSTATHGLGLELATLVMINLVVLLFRCRIKNEIRIPMFVLITTFLDSVDGPTPSAQSRLDVKPQLARRRNLDRDHSRTVSSEKKWSRECTTQEEEKGMDEQRNRIILMTMALMIAVSLVVL